MLVKKTVDDWLDSVDYDYLNNGNYQPSNFSLKFINMIKLINGEKGEDQKSPVFHLKMLDNIIGDKENVVNLCYRGAAKTSIFIEYLVFYITLFKEIEGFGEISGIIYVSDSMDNGCKSARKNIETRYNNSPWLQEFIPKIKFTDAYLELENSDGYKVGVRLFGAQTGLKGTKIFGKRPTLAILDDLIKDDGDARSKTIMDSIKDTVYKDVNYALDPTRKKTIFSGTPYNKQDVIYEAVESGGWHVNVYPVCEKFPCKEEEFVGAWEERFTYQYVKTQYELAKANGKLGSFNQELMLRITSEEDRLVQDSEINWYSRKSILNNLHNFNIYITTDASFSGSDSSDNGVISVWAISNKGDYFWLDGICKKQRSTGFINDLFSLVHKYYDQLQSVGVEASGQQGCLIDTIEDNMMSKNIFFTIARQKGTTHKGIKPSKGHGKLARFSKVVPLFSQGKFYFPQEMRETSIMLQFMSELKAATQEGLKGKDDCIDTISMLAYIDTIKPTLETLLSNTKNSNSIYDVGTPFDNMEDYNRINSYIV